jgi:hypothetical protein
MHMAIRKVDSRGRRLQLRQGLDGLLAGTVIYMLALMRRFLGLGWESHVNYRPVPETLTVRAGLSFPSSTSAALQNLVKANRHNNWLMALVYHASVEVALRSSHLKRLKQVILC